MSAKHTGSLYSEKSRLKYMVQSLLFIWHLLYSNMILVWVHTVHRMIIEPTLKYH